MIGRSAVLCVRPPGTKAQVTTTTVLHSRPSTVPRTTGSKGWMRAQGCDAKMQRSPPKGLSLSAAGREDAVRAGVERGPHGTVWADDEGDDDDGQ